MAEEQSLTALLRLTEKNTEMLTDLKREVQDLKTRALTSEQKDELLNDMSERQWNAKAYDKIVKTLKSIVLLSTAVAACIYLYENFINWTK